MDFLSDWDTPQLGGLLQFCTAAAARCVAVVLLIVASFYGSWLWSLLTSGLALKIKPAAQKDYRQGLDDAIMRRSVRAEFFRTNKNFDHNCHSSQSDKEKRLKVTEAFVKNSKGMEIFVKSWAPADSGRLRGLIFLCLGYGDTVTFYAEGLARALALAGYAVYGMDYPGFGMSEGLHGYIPNMGNLVDDVIEQYQKIKEREELTRGLPCFVYGESMGGAVALQAHLKEPTIWDGAILAAPMCKIVKSMYPSPVMVQLLTKLSLIIPKAKLVPINDIMKVGFRDEVKRKLANLNPVFYVGYTRLGTGVQLLQTADHVEQRMHEVSLPMLILHGTQDQVTDASVSKLLYEKAQSTDKTLQLYEDAWHGILQGEPDDQIHVVMKDMISWLDARAAPKAGFEPLNERELEERVGSAVTSLINFGRLDQIVG